MHFQVWHDKAGNATPLSDNGTTFVDLTKNQPETLQANLIMPEPCDFISGKGKNLLSMNSRDTFRVRDLILALAQIHSTMDLIPQQPAQVFHFHVEP